MHLERPFSLEQVLLILGYVLELFASLVLSLGPEDEDHGVLPDREVEDALEQPEVGVDLGVLGDHVAWLEVDEGGGGFLLHLHLHPNG